VLTHASIVCDIAGVGEFGKLGVSQRFSVGHVVVGLIAIFDNRFSPRDR